MPTSERLLLLRGALAAFETDTTYTPELAAAGVTREGFHLLTRPQRWKGSEVELARRALEGVISASFMVAGVTPLPAHCRVPRCRDCLSGQSCQLARRGPNHRRNPRWYPSDPARRRRHFCQGACL